MRFVLLRYVVVAVLAVGAAGTRMSVPDTHRSPAVAAFEAGPIVVRYVAPVAPLVIVQPFVAPRDRYGPGHRGVDLATGRRGAVRAAADGVVRFAGQIAGRGVVVLAHADGLVTEYEPLEPSVRAGESVMLGELLGHVLGPHRSCVPDRCVHWAARRGANYLDPMTLLAPLGEVRLLPWELP
jgi:murein DD-endopeptidase MepM/ murein hydrolase activator NlpD